MVKKRDVVISVEQMEIHPFADVIKPLLCPISQTH